MSQINVEEFPLIENYTAEEPPMEVAPSTPTAARKRIDGLQPIFLRTNYKLGKIKLAHWTIYHLGSKVDEVAEQMIIAIRRESGGKLHVGWAAEHDNQPGVKRPLRIVSALHPLHRVAVDMIFCAEGPDLYVRFELVTRSWITYLRYALYAGTFTTLFLTLYSLFYSNTGVYRGLAQEFARKVPSGDAAMSEAKYTSGAFGEKWTLLRFFQDDPKLFLTSMGGPPTIIAGAIGMMLYAIPKDLLRYPCRWLGWPSPNSYKDHAIQFAVRMDGAFSSMLRNVYGVYEPDGCRRVDSE